MRAAYPFMQWTANLAVYCFKMQRSSSKKIMNRICRCRPRTPGGSSGIGLATAQRFVAEGAYVFITGRRQAELDKAKKLIGKSVTTVQGDISNLDDLERLCSTVKKEKGILHIVVANAGITELATPKHYDKTYNIIARGTFFTIQKAVPLMTAGGAIVTVGSVAYRKGVPP
jgi:NAD(P)-dependent dehydrogenase (short-subunit alcohol dehydrogenase family)